MRPHRQQPTRLPRPWDSLGKNTGVGCHFLLQCMKVKSESEVAQSCPTLSDPMDCSLPGSSIHGIFQARVLEWGAIAFSRLQSMGWQRVRHDCHYGINHNGKEHKQKRLCVCVTESLCCTAESTVFQLYFNFKKQNKVIKEIYKLLN